MKNVYIQICKRCGHTQSMEGLRPIEPYKQWVNSCPRCSGEVNSLDLRDAIDVGYFSQRPKQQGHELYV